MVRSALIYAATVAVILVALWAVGTTVGNHCARAYPTDSEARAFCIANLETGY